MPIMLEDWAVDFTPALGGSVKSCTYQGEPILRPSTGTDDARSTAAFPMVPFIGRITKGQFQFQGTAFTLPPNMPPEPHAIHGHGWQSAWDLSTGSPTSIHSTSEGYAQLTHSHTGATGWPWPYTATQRFSARANTLTLAMSLTNDSERDMPAGLGWHPYFPKDDAEIGADISHVWAGATGQIIGDRPGPLTPETDLRIPRKASDLTLDHCFSAGDEGAKLVWPSRGLSLHMSASAALRHLTVYIPHGENYICVEPVSHAPDALNSALPANVTGLQILKPSQTLSAEITLKVERF